MPIISLNDLSRKLHADNRMLANKFCLHGYPGSGKTLLAGTLMKVPGIKRIFWADLEDGAATLVTSTTEDNQPIFTEEELAKVVYLPIPDRTQLDPGTAKLLGLATSGESNALAARILLRCLLSNVPIHYDTQRRAIVTKPNEDTVTWCLKGLGEEDALVIDSGTQLGASIFSLALEANPDHNHGKKHWGEFTTNANAVLSALQAARCTVVFICHTLDIEADPAIKKRGRSVPWFGSEKFSNKVGHYFGTVVFLYTDTGYNSLSTPVRKTAIQAKSRFSIDSSLIHNPTMSDLIGLTELSKEARTHIKTTQSASNKPSTGAATSGTSKPAGALRPGKLIKRA